MIAYILQVVLFQLLFLGVYEVLLKKETFFTYNRWYLLATSVVSLLLPLIKIEALAFLLPAESLNGISTVWLPEVIIGDVPAAVSMADSTPIPSSGFSINWWLVAYGTGVTASLFLFYRKYRDLSRLFRFRTIAAEKELRIIEVPNSTIACTFYKTIFLGDKLTETERQQILSHELVHVKQKHSLDLLFFELYKIIFWFNPLIYIYQNRLASLHEFIADAEVVRTTEKRSYYEQMLNSAFNTSNISFINQFFNHSLIKKRIVMLQKSKSKTIAKAKYLLLLPLMLVMLTYVACSDDKEVNGSKDVAQYNFILRGGDEESSDKDAENYFKFIKENPDYVGWRIVDHVIETTEFSVHSKDEVVPEDYKEYQYLSQIGEKRAHYVKEITADAITTLDSQKIKELLEINGSLPFGVIEEVPVFPGCENLGNNDAAKECMSNKIMELVSENYNTDIGKELGLKGVNRSIVVFEINENGEVENVRARAQYPYLEEEAKRVVNLLPQMTPGIQDGVAVTVSYSLPIVFQAGE